MNAFYVLSFILLSIPNFGYAYICSDNTCPAEDRYQLACYTHLEEPHFYFEFDLNSVHDKPLQNVAYKNGRDLSLIPMELWSFKDGPQMMRGAIVDLHGSGANVILDDGTQLSKHQIYVLADEWECVLYDNGPQGK